MGGFGPYGGGDAGRMALKSEIGNFHLFLFLIFRLFHLHVNLIRFDHDGSERPYRANGLASSASDAQIWIDVRDGQCTFERNHLHRLSRAVLGACPAVRIFGVDDTTLDEKVRDSNLGSRFLLFRDFAYGMSGAYV